MSEIFPERQIHNPYIFDKELIRWFQNLTVDYDVRRDAIEVIPVPKPNPSSLETWKLDLSSWTEFDEVGTPIMKCYHPFDISLSELMLEHSREKSNGDEEAEA